MPSLFKYLVRFTDQEGVIRYGNIDEECPPEALVGRKVAVLSGDPITGLQVTDQEKVVTKVCI